MTRAPKVIAPKASEPARSSTTTGGLPDELLDEQLRRLRLCAAVAMGLWTFGLVMDTFVRPGTVGSPFLASTAVIEGVAIVVSGLLFAYLRFTTHPPRIQAPNGSKVTIYCNGKACPIRKNVQITRTGVVRVRRFEQGGPMQNDQRCTRSPRRPLTDPA